MTHIAQLYEGSRLIRLMPLHADAPLTMLTPRLLPPRLLDLDPEPASLTVADRWRRTAYAEGTMTAEGWLRTFPDPLPDDLDRTRFEIPVTWIRYEWDGTA